MIKVVCDRCGAEIKADEKPGYISIRFRNSAEGDFITENPFKYRHYCVACMGKVEEFIMSDPETGAVAEDEPMPEAESKPKAAAKVRPKAILREKPTDISSATPGGEIEQLELKPKGRRKTDFGKIMSLRNAGWNNKEIGEEMGMTANAVSYAVWSWKRKMAAKAAGDDKRKETEG